VGRGRTSPSGVEKWFTDLPRVRIAMETGTHSIWVSERLQEMGHEVIVANVRELRAISHSDRKSDRLMRKSWPATPGSIQRSCGRSRTARWPSSKP
jgi:transposase